jgi:stress-induced-phosphoprotein 1
LKHYNKAAEIDTSDMVFHLNIGAVYLEMKDYDKCIESCLKAQEVGSENRADFQTIAKAFARAGKASAAAERLDDAVKYYDKALSNHRFKDYLTAKQGVERKIKELKRREKIDPNLADEAKARGNVFFKESKFPEAIKEYTEALERNPDDGQFCSRVHSNRSACYTKMMEIPHALKDAEACIKLDPAFVKGYLRKGGCLIIMKKYTEAKEAFNEALKVSPNHAEALEGIRKADMAKYGDQASMSREERAAAAMQDPEIQQILADPVMRTILEQMQQDPSSAQSHLANPEIRAKMMKLAESGFLEMR